MVQLAIGTCATVGVLALWLRSHRALPGVRWFFLGQMAVVWWMLSVAIEMSATTLQCQTVWARISWLGIVLLPTLWSFFLYEYTASRKVPRAVQWMGLLVIPFAVFLTALTNPLHQLFYGPETRLIVENGRAFVDYDHGPLFYATIGYLYLVIVSCSVIAGLAAQKASPAVRSFFSKLFATTLFPVCANLMYLIGGVTLFGTDPTPFSFALSLAVMFWLIADNRWADINSIARELLFYNSIDPVFLIDTQGQLFDANSRAKALLRERTEAGERLLDVPGIGEALQALVDHRQLPEVMDVDYAGRSYTVRHYPVALGPGRLPLAWVVAFVDVTIQKLAAERAQAADRAKTQFVATVSHELRTPLTVINGSLKLLSNQLGGMSEAQAARLVELATKNAGTLAALVDDLLEVQRLEGADFQMELQPCDLRDVVDESLVGMENYQSHKQVDLRYDRLSEPAVVWGDRKRLRQVLTNVLSNAIKFSPDRAEVELRLFIERGAAFVEVKDRGRGIPPNCEDKVFGRFLQVDSSDAKEVNGSGLGMHISRQLLLKHNGRISYAARSGGGTTFTVELPLRGAMLQEAC